MKRRAVRVTVVLVALMVAAAGTIAFAGTTRIASIKPSASICLGNTFQVGVRYRSGQSRRYAIRVVEPSGAALLSRSGRAKRVWRRWTVRPRMAGSHRVDYVLAGKRKRYYVRVNDCSDPGIEVTDNDAGSAALDMSEAAPGDVATSCIVVTYRATRSGSVRLYGATTGTGLDEHLDVVVTRGSVPPDTPFGSCEGFTPDGSAHIGSGAGVIYRGTLRAFPDTYETALTAPSAAWANGESHAYRIDVKLRSNDAAQGRTAEQVFVWEARL